MSTSVGLSNLSSNREIFKQHTSIYNNALRLSSFKDKVSFLEDTRFKIKLYGLSNPCAPSVSCILTWDNKGSPAMGITLTVVVLILGNIEILWGIIDISLDTRIKIKNDNSNRIHDIMWFAPLFSLQVH